ncbi:MAG: copper homeostasis protein CutC [Bacteroidaceae bacterium]|nr:copper homeostasis protein CutC [Bacteroidaceae bacterium]
MMTKYYLEACCQSAQDALTAQNHGASRIELCEDLACDGLTPSLDTIRETLRSVSIPVNVLIRLRAGNFVYDKDEIAKMCLSIGEIRDLRVVTDDENGAERKVNAVVIGALTEEGEIDIPAVKEMMDAAGGLPITFHRAFDVCAHPKKAYEQLSELGIARILTSGQVPTAVKGSKLLAELVQMSASPKENEGRPTILVGGGVRPSNIDTLAEETGAQEFHSSYLLW